MSERHLVVIPGDYPPQCQGSPQLDRLQQYGEVRLFEDVPKSLDEQVERAKDATVLINSRSIVKWPAAVLRQLPRLRMVSLCAIGTDAVDLDEARARGIVVSNIRGITAPIVAEHALGLLLAVAKMAAYQTATLKSGVWQRMENIYLRDKTLGVVGAGNIGAEMARLGRAIGMNVIAWTFHPSPERAEELGVRFVDMDTLLRESDVVSLHVALSAESHHLIGRKELELMKPGALLINVARGAVVNEAALVDALNSGHLAGAGLDVFEDEPPPLGAPILSCDQVVLTPHVGDMTPEGTELLNVAAVDNVIAFLEGRPQNVVT